MTDNLFFTCFVFVFFQEISCSGKSNLIDIFFYFVSSHTNTVVDELQSLFFWIYQYLNLGLKILWKLVFSH